MRQKICALMLTLALALTSIGTAFAAEPPNAVQSKLALIEQDTYGREQTGALIDRINRLERDGNLRAGTLPLSAERNQTQVSPYGIWGINAGYNWNKRVAVRGGISNLFDKKLYRTGNGAQTYNEHGRAFYGSLKVSF